jgi:hypothetical protein
MKRTIRAEENTNKAVWLRLLKGRNYERIKTKGETGSLKDRIAEVLIMTLRGMGGINSNISINMSRFHSPLNLP